MELKEGNTLYIRMDYKIGEQEESEQDAQDCMIYLQKLAQERYLVAGLLGNLEQGEMEGALVLFEAKNREEAERLSQNDPIIKRGFYRYELHHWNLMLVSEKR